MILIFREQSCSYCIRIRTLHLHLALAPCTYTLCQRFVDISGQTWNWSFQAWLSGTFSSCIRNVDAKCKVQVRSIHEDWSQDESQDESQAWQLQFQVCPAMSTKRWHKVQVQQLHNWSLINIDHRLTSSVSARNKQEVVIRPNFIYIPKLRQNSFVSFLYPNSSHVTNNCRIA